MADIFGIEQIQMLLHLRAEKTLQSMLKKLTEPEISQIVQHLDDEELRYLISLFSSDKLADYLEHIGTKAAAGLMIRLGHILSGNAREL